MTHRDRAASALLSVGRVVLAFIVVTVMSFTGGPISIQFISRIAHVIRFSKSHFGYVHTILGQTSGRVWDAVIVNEPSPEKHVLLSLSNPFELVKRDVYLWRAVISTGSENERICRVLGKSSKIETFFRMHIADGHICLLRGVISGSSSAVLPSEHESPSDNGFAIWRRNLCPPRPARIDGRPLRRDVHVISSATNHIQQSGKNHQNGSKKGRPSGSGISAEYVFNKSSQSRHGCFVILFLIAGAGALGFILSLWRTVELIGESQSPLIAVAAALISASVFCVATWGAFTISHRN